MDPETIVELDETRLNSITFRCRSDENIFGELHGHFEIQNDHFQAKNSHFRPFWHLSQMKVIKKVNKMDDTILPSAKFRCRSDKTIFGELHGHFEIQNGHFQAKNSHFKLFWLLSQRKVIKNIIEWMIPYSLVQLFAVAQIKIF